MLTLRDLIGDLDVRLVAGEANLGVPVRWVHISELADPTPFLSGGELLLTTGMALDTPKKQREFVARLASHGLAGLGYGTGFAHQRIPKAIADTAAEHGFPLFEVPYDTPFIAITERAFTRLVNEQYALLRRSIAAQERLLRRRQGRTIGGLNQAEAVLARTEARDDLRVTCAQFILLERARYG